MPEVADNALDGFFQAEEIMEGWIDFDRAVHENPPEPLVVGRVDELWFADGREHAF